VAHADDGDDGTLCQAECADRFLTTKDTKVAKSTTKLISLSELLNHWTSPVAAFVLFVAFVVPVPE
jgi:hypothetical protein